MSLGGIVACDMTWVNLRPKLYPKSSTAAVLTRVGRVEGHSSSRGLQFVVNGTASVGIWRDSRWFCSPDRFIPLSNHVVRVACLKSRVDGVAGV